MPKIFACANQKGGVGKTTTAVNMGVGLARNKIKTLLVDLDPQGHLSLSFGLKKAPGLFRLVCLDEPLNQVKENIQPYLDLIPSDKQTEKVKRMITLADYRESILADLLHDTTYDVIILDLAPSLDILHINGLIASDWVIIPTRLDALAVDGVKEILGTMNEITQSGHAFSGYNILPTFFDRTTRETLLQFDELVHFFGQYVWAPIPQDTKVRESAAFGKTMWDYAPNSPSMQGFLEKKVQIGGYQNTLKLVLEVLNGI